MSQKRRALSPAHPARPSAVQDPQPLAHIIGPVHRSANICDHWVISCTAEPEALSTSLAHPRFTKPSCSSSPPHLLQHHPKHHDVFTFARGRNAGPFRGGDPTWRGTHQKLTLRQPPAKKNTRGLLLRHHPTTIQRQPMSATSPWILTTRARLVPRTAGAQAAAAEATLAKSSEPIGD